MSRRSFALVALALGLLSPTVLAFVSAAAAQTRSVPTRTAPPRTRSTATIPPTNQSRTPRGGWPPATDAAPTDAPWATLPIPRPTATARFRAPTITDTVRSGRVAFVGDSVMLGAAPALRERFGESTLVDGDVSRQYGAGLARLGELQAAGRLGEAVVIHLGNNGIITREQLAETMRLLAGVRYLYFVNVRVPRPWEPEVNATLRAAALRWPRIRIIDWRGATAGLDDLFTRDQVHLRPAGARFYADVIACHLAADWRPDPLDGGRRIAVDGCPARPVTPTPTGRTATPPAP